MKTSRLKEFPDSTKISLTNYCIDVLRTDGITSSEGAVALTCIFGISEFEVSEEVFNFRFNQVLKKNDEVNMINKMFGVYGFDHQDHEGRKNSFLTHFLILNLEFMPKTLENIAKRGNYTALFFKMADETLVNKFVKLVDPQIIPENILNKLLTQLNFD